VKYLLESSQGCHGSLGGGGKADISVKLSIIVLLHFPEHPRRKKTTSNQISKSLFLFLIPYSFSWQINKIKYIIEIYDKKVYFLHLIKIKMEIFGRGWRGSGFGEFFHLKFTPFFGNLDRFVKI
jgi:hypothetical protein